jgi:hypothetical protein
MQALFLGRHIDLAACLPILKVLHDDDDMHWQGRQGTEYAIILAIRY